MKEKRVIPAEMQLGQREGHGPHELRVWYKRKKMGETEFGKLKKKQYHQRYCIKYLKLAFAFIINH